MTIRWRDSLFIEFNLQIIGLDGGGREFTVLMSISLSEQDHGSEFVNSRVSRTYDKSRDVNTHVLYLREDNKALSSKKLWSYKLR